VTKQPRSFSVDEELVEMLSERDDINASGAVNTFLREYLAGGRGPEAAIEVRINQLDEDIAELERDLERKRRERDRLEDRVRSRREDRADVIADMVDRINDGTFPPENLEPTNAAVQNWASEAGIDTEQYISEVRDRL